MDFSVRGANHQPAAANQAPPASMGSPKHSSKVRELGGWFRITAVVLLFCITILLVSVTFLFHYGPANEGRYVNASNFQAIDITVGGSNSSDQIYFGHLKNLNDRFVVLDDVYYIPSSSNSSSITLQPLVCQVDVPYNQMIINRTSVNWWENLQPNGKVASTISSYEKQNPKGPNCPTTTSGSSSSSPSSSTTTTPSTKQ